LNLHQATIELQEKSQELSKLYRQRTLRRILKLVVVGFFLWKDLGNKILQLTTRKDQIINDIRRHCNQASQKIDERIQEIKNNGTYLIHADKEQCLDEIESLGVDLAYLDENGILEPEYILAEKEKLERLHDIIENYNRKFIEQRKKEYAYLWNKGLLSLDDEQQTAIVTDDKYNLVVAAAGSGKTEALITRIAYLKVREPDGVKPHRILAIAYQNKDVKQIEQRLEKQYGITGVNVRTFHGLGIDVLRRAGKMKSIIDKNERPRIVKSTYQDKLKSDSEFYQTFLNYVKSLHETEVEKDVANKVSTLAMKKTLPYTSIDDTQVQSRAEKEILDFLLTSKLSGNLIHVRYEPQIEELGKPDFFLPEYDLFIEHWGLNKNGEVPEWFNQTTVEYKENMERKKTWFVKNDKLLVETFAYEYDEDHPENFIQLLKDRIIEKLQSRYSDDFHFSTMTYRELIEVVCESDRDWISKDRVSRDIFNFIKNAKTYDLKPKRILQKLESGKWSRKQRTFGKLATGVYEGYQEKLSELQKIDFEDMINNAIDELKKDKKLCKNFYDHILVDEYQDITQQTHELVKQLLNHNPTCKLFCVGDDWQSIMGFAGSNLEFFVNFEKHFENPAITKISTNYRSVGTIVDAGACLINNNRSCQINKKTISKNKEGKLIKVLRSPHRISYRENYQQQIAGDCISRVAEYLRNGYAKKDILILSRFMNVHTGEESRFHYIIENMLEEAYNRGIKISQYAKTSRNVRLLTVHKAKGLEAKVVFILNVIKDTYGFPCEIEDSSILEPARENYPLQDQKEEERRLFYVAMTRAKEDLYIYTWEPAKSEFLEEIKEHTQEERLSY